MEAEPTNPRPGIIPSPAQLACAVIVLQSKPETLSVSEHLENLKAHITSDRHSDMPGQKHLDGTAYWRQAFHRSELAQTKLLDKIYELEQEKDANANKAEAHGGVSAASGKRKRGVEPEPTHKANSQAKRRAASNQRALPSLNEMSSFPISNPSPGDNGTPKNAILRRIARLHKDLTARKVDGDMLARNFSEVCSAVFCLVREPINNLNPQSTQAKTPVKTTVVDYDVLDFAKILESAFSSLYLAMSKTRTVKSLEGHFDVLIVSLVGLFHTTLLEFDGWFIKQAQESADSAKRGTRPRTKKSRATKTRNAAWYKAHEDTVQLMAKLLQFMIRSLDLERETPNELLEGYCCVLLDRIGQCLSLQVFAQDIAMIPIRAHPSLAQPRTFQSHHTIDIRMRQQAARQQGSLLIRLLEDLLNLVTLRQSSMSINSPALFGIHKERSLSQQMFTDRVKLKLQNTLMQAVFGEDDEAFCDSLKKFEATIPPIKSLPLDDDTTHQDSSEWFAEEVWRMLGWDNLKN